MRILEINTWPWLAELSGRLGRAVALGDVPAAAWDELASYRFDAVWLMGVWRRSAAAQAVARAEPGVVARAAAVVPGFRADRDLLASPYAVADYAVDEELGGRAGLAAARRELAARGLKLLLDFVPNHTALDHPWTRDHPEYYVRGRPADLVERPGRFFRTPGGAVLALGAPSADPSSVWRDTAQLDAFHPGLRAAAVATLAEIADQCDGVRCDMAQLLESAAFAGTWGAQAGPAPASEFWIEVIGQARRRHPALLLVAEAYLGREWALQQQGFDLCYDKDLLYERLARGTADSIREHLQGASVAFQERLLHFVENHDEPPAEEVFRPRERLWMAATVAATLPGSSLWYQEQLEGRWGRGPVQLGRPVTARDFYRRLLKVTDRPALREGRWALCPVARSPTMIAWCWSRGEDRVLVAVNPSDDDGAWAHVAVPWPDLTGAQWRLRELLRGDEFGPRDGTDLVEGRLYLQPRPWSADLFELTRI